MNYPKAAARIWKRTAWIHGDGPFAVVAYCNVTTVSLHAERQDAEHSVGFIDRLGCGHQCRRDHRLIDLTEMSPA